jgi:hypothetical protein
VLRAEVGKQHTVVVLHAASAALIN